MVKKISDLPSIEVNLSHGTTVSATLTDAGTWYQLSSSDLVSVCAVGFSNTNGVITYNDNLARKIMFLGSAGFSTDKACQLEFGVFINGVFVDNAYSIEDVLAVNKTGGFSENACLSLSPGDVIDIRAKTDTANTEIIINVLSLILKW